MALTKAVRKCLEDLLEVQPFDRAGPHLWSCHLCDVMVDVPQSVIEIDDQRNQITHRDECPITQARAILSRNKE